MDVPSQQALLLRRCAPRASLLLAIILAVSFAVGGGPVALAQPGVQAYVEPAAATLAVGETQDVAVRLVGVIGLQSLQMNVSFDPAVLQVIDADAGTVGVQIAPGDVLAGASPIANNAGNGSGLIEYAILDATGFSGPGTIATITFQAVAPGSSAVDITALILYGAEGDISATTTGGAITVTAQTDTPTPTATATEAAEPTETLTPTLTYTPGPTATETAPPTIPVGGLLLRLPLVMNNAALAPTLTPTLTLTPGGATATSTPQGKFSPTPTPTATETPLPGPTATPTSSPEPSPTSTCTPAPPSCVRQSPAEMNVQVTENTTVYLTVAAACNSVDACCVPANGVQWYVNGDLVDDRAPFTGSDTYALAVTTGGAIEVRAWVYVTEFLGCEVTWFVQPVPAGTVTPQPSPTNTAPPSATPTITLTPSVGPTREPCDEMIDNNGAERDSDWYFPETAYPAVYSTTRAHSGSRSLRTGIESGWPAYSYSSAEQAFRVPDNAVNGTLRFWYYAQATGSASDNDRHYVLLLDEYNNYWTLMTLNYPQSNTRQWTEVAISNIDWRQYRGHTMRLRFETVNNGWGGVAAMYTDDVTLKICQ